MQHESILSRPLLLHHKKKKNDEKLSKVIKNHYFGISRGFCASERIPSFPLSPGEGEGLAGNVDLSGKLYTRAQSIDYTVVATVW